MKPMENTSSSPRQGQSAAPQSETASSTSPSTASPLGGSVRAPLPLQSAPATTTETRAAVAKAVAAARLAQQRWAALSYTERTPYIEKMRQYILRHADAIAATVSLATGKTRIDALAAEVLPSTMACDWYAKNAAKALAPKKLAVSSSLFLNKRSLLVREPLGVVAIISPWNYPLTIPFGELVMGLMAGNAIILKVSPETPAVGRLIEEIVASGELPAGLFHLVDGDGADVATALFAEKIDKIFFTGSVRVGKLLMRQAADTLTPLSLELGGKDPMLVLADADLERASNGAVWGAFQNAGQTCAGIERVYVDASIYDRFVSLVSRKTEALRHGVDGPGANDHGRVDMGRMTTRRQLDVVRQQVDAAVAAGARIIAQSKPAPGQVHDDELFFPATVLVDVDHRMEVMREETFGPLLCVMKYEGLDEAIALANDSSYGLTASIWSRNLSVAKRVARSLQAGVVSINDHLFTHALSEIPWGGPKQSGLGRTHGALGLEEMTVAKVVNWDAFPLKRNVYWYPYSAETYPSLKAAMHWGASRQPRQLAQYAAELLPYYLKKVFKGWEP